MPALRLITRSKTTTQNWQSVEELPLERIGWRFEHGENGGIAPVLSAKREARSGKREVGSAKWEVEGAKFIV